jgi:hypothetical protein
MNTARRNALILAATPLMLLGAGRALADTKKPLVKLPFGGGGGQQPRFVKPAGIEDAVKARATGVYLAASLNTPAGQRYDTLTLINQGNAIEVHTKRAGAGYLPKRPGAHSVRTIAPATFDQLIALAGGVSRNVEGRPAKAQFLQVAGLGTGGGEGTTGGTAGGGSVPPCPSDWAGKSALQRAKIEHTPLLRHQYAGCLSELMPVGEPRRALFARVWDALPPLIGSAQAAEDEAKLVFLSISFDNLFKAWAFEYNPQQGYTAFNAFGITAIWSVG